MKSIQDTMKITNAMYMMSSSKMKKAKKSLADTEPYFFALQKTLNRILKTLPDVDSSYFSDRRDGKGPEERVTGYILITADKGLAGAYNHNVVKLAHQELDAHPNHKLFVLGNLGRQYFMKKDQTVDPTFEYVVQNPTLHRARLISEYVVDQYNRGELDEVYIIFTQMVTAMSSAPKMIKILPLDKADYNEELSAEEIKGLDTFTYWPSESAVIDCIVPSVVTGYVYSTLVEAYCSEQNARMMAMEAATDSAKDLLRELSVMYNRARQGAITQQITEIVGGAKAQKQKGK